MCNSYKLKNECINYSSKKLEAYINWKRKLLQTSIFLNLECHQKVSHKMFLNVYEEFVKNFHLQAQKQIIITKFILQKNLCAENLKEKAFVYKLN